MFTGIIRQLGSIKDTKSDTDGSVLLDIEMPNTAELREGDSVAVNGVCLTVLDATKETWKARLMHETLQKTNLGKLQKGQSINIEQSLKASDSLDGHFVQGHVDGTVSIIAITPKGDDKIFTFSLPKSLQKLIVPKGSVSLNGVSLTIVDVLSDSFTVSMMPYTVEHTTFGQSKVDDVVNIETDMLAKHVVAILERYTK